MDVETTRFGVVHVGEDRLITFSAGLLGFTAYKTYALLRPDEDGAFLWLQSLEAPELAFVVTDPGLWIGAYQVPIRREQMEELALEAVQDADVLVIINRYGEALTANLQGPLVINPANRRGVQLVLADKRWSTRHEIVQVSQEAVAAASA